MRGEERGSEGGRSEEVRGRGGEERESEGGRREGVRE